MQDITHLARPLERPLGLWRQTSLHAELVRDPVRKQELLDLAVRELSNQTDSKLDGRLGLLRVQQAPLYRLKDGGHMGQENLVR